MNVLYYFSTLFLWDSINLALLNRVEWKVSRLFTFRSLINRLSSISHVSLQCCISCCLQGLVSSELTGNIPPIPAPYDPVIATPNHQSINLHNSCGFTAQTFLLNLTLLCPRY